jgi:hypothetical protein
MGLAAIHHDMLALMTLAIHGERIERGRLVDWGGSRRGGSVVGEFQSTWRIGPVLNGGSLV